MKTITLRSVLDNGELIEEEEDIKIKEKDIIIIKIPSTEHGTPMFTKEHIEKIYDVIKDCLVSNESNPLLILPESVKIQILSIR